MKTTLLFSTGLASLLLVVHAFPATDVVAGWNAALDTAQQTSRQNYAGRTRADAIVRTALAEAMTGLEADKQSGRPAEPTPVGANLDAAAAQAAYSVMAVLYPQNLPALDARLAQSLAEIADSASAIAAGKKWGEHVAQVIIAEAQDAVSLNAGSFAEAAQKQTIATPISTVQAEQQAIGPGRYRFSILAGVLGAKGYVDATREAARFDNLGGIAVDATGTVYVSERVACTIRKVTPDGVVTTFAGTAGQAGSQDGAGSAARFNAPQGLSVDGAGNVYVADTGNQTIRRIDSSGNVITLAGKAGEAGIADGTQQSARLFNPTFLAVDAAGNVFVTEYKSYIPISQNPIRRIASDGTVSSLAVEGIASDHFNPGQLCVDPDGVLYVFYYHAGPMEDLANVIMLTPTTAEGKYTATPMALSGSEFGGLISMSMDGAGSLFLHGSGGEGFKLRVYTPGSGWQNQYPAGTSDGDWMQQFAVGQSRELHFFQNLYSPGGWAGGVVGIGAFDPKAAGPVITEQPWTEHPAHQDSMGWPYPGDPVTFHVAAVGGLGLSYQWYLNSTPISGATSASWTLKGAQKSDEGYYSVFVSDAAGSLTSDKTQLLVVASFSAGNGTGSSGSGTGSSSTGSVTSGAGSFDAGISLVVLCFLVVAARRGVHGRLQDCGLSDS